MKESSVLCLVHCLSLANHQQPRMGEEGKGLAGVGVVHELKFALGITPREVGRGNLLVLAFEIEGVASSPWLHDLVRLYLYGMEKRTIL